MPSIRSSRSCNVIIFAAISTVIVAGCGGGTVCKGVTSASSATSTPSATTASPKSTPSATTASPKTVSQAAWVAGIKALEKKMTDAGGSGSGVVTSKWMRDVSKQLGGCTAELSRLGPATYKEQVAFLAAKQGCAKYEEAAKCLAQGKADSPALDKCFDAMNRGSELFSIAGSAAEIIH